MIIDIKSNLGEIMAGKKWTKEEEEYLLKNYKKANRVLAKELNRNIGSVQQK